MALTRCEMDESVTSRLSADCSTNHQSSFIYIYIYIYIYIHEYICIYTYLYVYKIYM